jgi:hypothetical protein
MTDIRATQNVAVAGEQSDATKLHATQSVAIAGEQSALTAIKVTQCVVIFGFPAECPTFTDSIPGEGAGGNPPGVCPVPDGTSTVPPV